MDNKRKPKNQKINLNKKGELKTPSNNKWVAIGLIILATFIVYYNSLNAPFILDDMGKIVNNPDIKKLSNIKTKLIYPYSAKHKTFYRNDPSRPLVSLTFTLNYYYGKLNPFGYRLFNIIVHICSSILVFFLVKEIILYINKEDSIVFPFLVALFFAVHPISTAAVTYIYKRSDLLSTLFYILSLLFFVKTFKKNKKLYIFSLICFILSLFSKPNAITLPATIFLIDYIFISDFQLEKVKVKRYYHMCFWIILFIYLLFRYFYLGGIGDLQAKGSGILDRYSYFIIQPYLILRYLESLFIPIKLCIYHHIRPMGIFEFKVLRSFILLIIMFICVYKIYKKHTNISKIILFCILWFFITLSPTQSFFPTTTYMDDNRLYLPAFGFYLCVGFIYFDILKRGFFGRKILRWKLFTIIVIHICLLGITTVKRNQLFRSPTLMWQDVISMYPQNYAAHSGLGNLYKEQKEYTKAIEEFKKAGELNPHFAEPHNNLGLVYYEQKEYTKAIEEYQKALEIKPNLAISHLNLGVVYKEQKKYDKAIKEYKKALEIDSSYAADVYTNLGVLYFEQKKYDEAIKEYKKALSINPNHTIAQNNLKTLYKQQKGYGNLIEEYKKILETEPDNIRIRSSLAGLYYDEKNYSKAIQENKKMLEINPNDAKIYTNLGYLYYLQKEYNKALKEFTKALEINPNSTRIHHNLADLYYETKQYRKALQSLESVLELDPKNKTALTRVKTLKEALNIK